MNKSRIIIYLFLPIFLVLGCKSTLQVKESDSLDSVIGEYLQGEFDKVISPEKDFVLATRIDKTSGVPVLKFGVWEIKTTELLYAGSAIRGTASWLDNSSLLITDYPGINEGESSLHQFKIDLKTKTKVKLYETEEL